MKIVLHEGRKHIVRRLLDAVGHPVVRLVRTDIGPSRSATGGPAPCGSSAAARSAACTGRSGL